jgi:tetratricopeptide (TPR) repeat protein
MAKTGRNHPCPCGSGKKYKLCCLDKDAAIAAAARAADRAQHELHQHEPACSCCGKPAMAAGAVPASIADELDERSNAVIDLVHEGKLDQAEAAAKDLLVRFPFVHDGHDRLGMVYEARGEHKRAADCYRKVIEFVSDHQDDYDPHFADTFHKLVARLDPSPAAPRSEPANG